MKRSCAFLAVGAATLADIYEPHKRGTKVRLHDSIYLNDSFVSLDGTLLHGATAWASKSYTVHKMTTRFILALSHLALFLEVD